MMVFGKQTKMSGIYLYIKSNQYWGHAWSRPSLILRPDTGTNIYTSPSITDLLNENCEFIPSYKMCMYYIWTTLSPSLIDSWKEEGIVELFRLVSIPPRNHYEDAASNVDDEHKLFLLEETPICFCYIFINMHNMPQCNRPSPHFLSNIYSWENKHTNNFEYECA